MIIDIHTHVGLDKDGMSQTLEELIARMDSNRIDYAATFPLNEKNQDLISASMALLNVNNPRIMPFLRFDPHTTSPDAVESRIDKFRGVKLHPTSQQFDPLDKKFYPLYEVIQKHAKPLLIHTKSNSSPYADPDKASLLADDFPDLDIILGHFASCSEEAIKMVSKHDNLYLETSIHSLYPVKIEKALAIVGADKVLFGSDIPYADQELELLKVKKCRVSPDDMDKMLYRNAARLLKMDAGRTYG